MFRHVPSVVVESLEIGYYKSANEDPHIRVMAFEAGYDVRYT